MVKRKSTPRKAKVASEHPATKKKRETRAYKIGSKKFKVNATTLKQIRLLQNTVDLCIPRLPFSRLIREILMEHGSSDLKIQYQALTALQEAAEVYLTYLFEDANRCAYHARRVTVNPKDMHLVLDIRGCMDPGFMT